MNSPTEACQWLNTASRGEQIRVTVAELHEASTAGKLATSSPPTRSTESDTARRSRGMKNDEEGAAGFGALVVVAAAAIKAADVVLVVVVAGALEASGNVAGSGPT